MSSRFFFNLTNGEDVICDDDGILVSDIHAALIYAMEVIRELQAEDPSTAAEWKGWRLDITDDTGRVVESLSLGDSHSANGSRH
jgi:hypothetical protein